MTTAAPATAMLGSLTGYDITVCVLIHFYVLDVVEEGEPLNDVGPLLSRVLAFTARCIFETDKRAPTLETFMALFDAYLRQGKPDTDTSSGEDGLIRDIIQGVAYSVSQARSLPWFHGFFTRLERLLMREEMYDEVQNVTIKPPERQIDEASPFGHFLHRCLEIYFGLQDDEFAPLLADIDQNWVRGGQESPQTAPSAAILVDRALKKGDYAAARVVLEGSFSQPPADASGSSLASILLRSAQFHLRTKALDKARETLEEALRLARGANDSAIITRCDELARKIKLQADRLSTTSSLTETPKSKTTKKITAVDAEELEAAIDDGANLIAALSSIDNLEAQARKGKVKEVAEAPDTAKVCELLNQDFRLWRAMGSTENASITIAATRTLAADVDPTQEVTVRLNIALSASTNLAEAGHVSEALVVMVQPSLLASLDLDLLQMWHEHVLRILYRSARRCGLEATTEAIVSLRPEVCRGLEPKLHTDTEEPEPGDFRPNEASFGRNCRATHEENMLGRLLLARDLCCGPQSAAVALQIASEVREQATTSCHFEIARAAICQAAEALAQLGMVEQARIALDKVMPHMLTGRNAEARASAAFVYAKILLTQHARFTASDDHHIRRNTLDDAMQWLKRAETVCTEADLLSLRKDVLYYKARLFDLQNRAIERDDAAHACLRTEAELRARSREVVSALQEVQDIAALAGARIVAGA